MGACNTVGTCQMLATLETSRAPNTKRHPDPLICLMPLLLLIAPDSVTAWVSHKSIRNTWERTALALKPQKSPEHVIVKRFQKSFFQCHLSKISINEIFHSVLEVLSQGSCSCSFSIWQWLETFWVSKAEWEVPWHSACRGTVGILHGTFPFSTKWSSSKFQQCQHWEVLIYAQKNFPKLKTHNPIMGRNQIHKFY